MITRSLKVATVALTVAALLLTVTACGGNGEPEGGADTGQGDTAPTGEPIVIGAAMARTGFMAQFDMPDVIGAQMAIEDINEQGGLLGRELEFVHIDSKSDKAQAANAATELFDQRAADAIIVSCDFDFGGPAASVAQQNDKIAFGCAASPRFGAQGIGSNAFTLDTYTQGEGAAAAEWAYQRKGWRSVYILTDNSIDYTKTLSQFFQARWEEQGGEVAGTDTFLNDDPSVSAQVTRIQSSRDHDFIFVPSCPPGAATAIRQIRAAGMQTPIMAGVCMDGDFWLDAVPNLSEFYYTPWINTYGDDPRDEVNEFIDRFLPRAGAFAQQRQFGVVGYSQIQAYARAVEEAGTTDTAAVRAALENFEEEPLLIGPTTFDETFHGDPGRPFAVMEIQQGEHKYIETWKPQKPPIPDFIEQG